MGMWARCVRWMHATIPTKGGAACQRAVRADITPQGWIPLPHTDSYPPALHVSRYPCLSFAGYHRPMTLGGQEMAAIWDRLTRYTGCAFHVHHEGLPAKPPSPPPPPPHPPSYTNSKLIQGHKSRVVNPIFQ